MENSSTPSEFEAGRKWYLGLDPLILEEGTEEEEDALWWSIGTPLTQEDIEDLLVNGI